MLELFTFGETRAFLQQFAAGGSLLTALRSANITGFKDAVARECMFNTLRMHELQKLPKEFCGKSIRKLARDDNMTFDALDKLVKFPIIRYLIDKRQSEIHA